MNLYKWEMKQMFKTKVFWFIGAAFFLLMCGFHGRELVKGGITAYEMFLTMCNDFTSLAMFFIGIFAGLHVTGALEERKLQAAIMAGNSRAKVLWTKFASFMSAIAIFFGASVVIPATIGFARFGLACDDGSFLRNVIFRAPVYLVAIISASAICFILSMICKKPGIAVIVNLVTLLTIDLTVGFIATKEWGEKILEYTPFGQKMIVLSDMSNKNTAIALSVSVAFAFLVLLGSYARFRKEELK